MHAYDNPTGCTKNGSLSSRSTYNRHRIAELVMHRPHHSNRVAPITTCAGPRPDPNAPTPTITRRPPCRWLISAPYAGPGHDQPG